MKIATLFVALALAAGCDDRVRVGLVLHTTALAPAQVAQVTTLSVDALYDGATNGTSDVTRTVALGDQTLEDPERIELVFPDTTTKVTLDVAVEGASGIISEATSATFVVGHGLTSVELSLPGPMQMGPMDLGDMSNPADLATPSFMTLPPIAVGAALTAAIVGNWELTGDEMIVGTSGGIGYKLPHLATAPYLGPPTSFNLVAINATPLFATAGTQLAAANTAGMVCLFSFSDSSSFCDNTGVPFVQIALANVPANDLGTRGLVMATTSAGLEEVDPMTSMAAPIDIVGTGGGAVVYAKLDADSIDVAYGAGANLRVCHGLMSCVPGPTLAGGAAITRLAAVDLDRDGKMDLFAFDGTLGHYLRNIGDTTATFQEEGTIAALGSPVLGDFNGDTAPDLAYITQDGTSVIVATLAGKTTPIATSLVDKVGAGLFALFAADLDGRLPIDLVAVDTTGKVTPIVHP